MIIQCLAENIDIHEKLLNNNYIATQIGGVYWTNMNSIMRSKTTALGIFDDAIFDKEANFLYNDIS